MKIKFTSIFLLASILSLSQEQINVSALEKISSQSAAKFKKELSQFQQESKNSDKTNSDLMNSFAGYVLGGPVFYHSSDSRQAVATNTDLLYNNSIPGVQVTGSGMNVYVWDGGNIRNTHNDLTGRVTNKEIGGSLSDHASGVAGVVMGTGNFTSGGVNSRGMAYQANLFGYNFTNNIAEISTESSNIANSEYLVSNHSYGTISGWQQGNYGMGNGWYWFGNDAFSSTESIYFGYYGEDDSSLDGIAYNSPQHVIVKSSGNDKNQGPGTTLAQHWAYNASWQWQQFSNVFRPNDCGQTGYDCIPTSSLGKNIITVGSVQPLLSGRYSQPSDVVLASDSSIGPADDGRIKPDVVAVGVSVIAPGAGNNNQYYNWSGTSFSAPAVTGNIVLLQQLYEQQYDTYLRSDLTKALVIHTANEAGDTPGPDYKFGWGLMDTAKAAEFIMGKDETIILQNHTLNNGDTYNFSVRGMENEPLKVTVVWLDPAGTVGNGHNERTPKLINDLDLRISDGLVEYLPWKLDVNNPSVAATKGDNILDNVEQIIIDNPIDGLNYEISINHKGNLQGGSQVFAIVISGAVFCPSSTIWDGLIWSNGNPDMNKKAIINGNLILNQNLEACELEVTSDGSLEIPSGFSFTVNGVVTNAASAESFVVASGGNLIQKEHFGNVGAITVERDSQPMKRLDYTLWSSPVIGQNLFGFSPDTVNGVTNYPGSTARIYIYDGANGYVKPNPFTAETLMNEAVGYLFRSPNNYHAINEIVYEGKFMGVPNNGNINVPVYLDEFTSVGNPYPSNIDADVLFDENENIYALYFWNNTGVAGNNYAAYTRLGGSAAGGGSETPTQFISVGQGFIVGNTDEAASVNLTNNMRVSDAGIFFKGNETEKHRLWLSLNNKSNQNLNNILVGYMTGATNAIDNQIDGRQFGYEGSALYNIIGEEKFSIQGRALPFENSDVVVLGFNAAESGKFNISLSNFDGLFSTGEINIYLKDKDLNVTHNLMESDYNFESTAGEFNTRFEIIYESDEVMGTNDLTKASVQIYKNNQNIVVESKNEKILSVELYDLSGRNIHTNNTVNANSYQIKSASKGVLVIKVQTQKGEIINRKIILK